MSASLIRSRAMVTHLIDRHRWNEVTDGAVLQEDGTIVEFGTYQELSRKHPNVAVVGSGNEVMLAAKIQEDLFGSYSPSKEKRTPGNTIRKVYLCRASTSRLKPGSILLFYRSRSQG